MTNLQFDAVNKLLTILQILKGLILFISKGKSVEYRNL